MAPLRIVFMGSPEIAVSPLRAILGSEDKVVGIISQPDRPAGRGREVTPPPIALVAREQKIPLLQPERIKGDNDFLARLKGFEPDLIVVTAYGKILPPEILGLPPRRCLNLHFSLLPRYRGAAPVQWALINGESETGVTTLLMTAKVDAGPILLQKKTLIEPEDNAEILGHRLSVAGAELLAETIESLKSDRLDPIPQDERVTTLAPPLKKEDGRIDWTRKAKPILCQIRGMTPWPGTFTSLDKKILKIYSAEVIPEKKSAPPGTITAARPTGLDVACGWGLLRLKEVQLEGGKRMEAAEFLRGHPIPVGGKLG